MTFSKEQRRKIQDEKFVTPTEVKTASELIDALRLKNQRWRSSVDAENYPDKEWGRRWLFRGQGNADWDLIPSAWRSSKDSPIAVGRKSSIPAYVKREIEYLQSQHPENNINWNAVQIAAEQVAIEIQIIYEFAELADSVGHRLPASKITPVFGLINEIVKGLAFPSEDAFHRNIWLDPLIGLAQHHGVPTRLLDWSRNPLSAAYFAAVDAENEKPKNGFAVFAISEFHLGKPKFERNQIRRADNPFLHAQEGVLIFHKMADEFYIENGYYPDLMNSAFDVGMYPVNPFKVYKFVLPKEEAPELIRLLFLERVTKAHLMPILDNVAHTIKEKWRYLLSPEKPQAVSITETTENGAKNEPSE